LKVLLFLVLLGGRPAHVVQELNNQRKKHGGRSRRSSSFTIERVFTSYVTSFS
jgi:hypothetical protein